MIERDYETIQKFEIITASLHYSKVDLSERNELIYRDKGYFGAGLQSYDKTTKE